MKVLIFGATGMVGQGVLRECLLDPLVEQVTAIGRSPSGRSDPKLRDILLPDLFGVDELQAELTGYDACFFCLGVSSLGLSEAEYTRVTYTLTLAVAGLLARLNPGMTFVYVSGTGTDGSGRSRLMWARVKGHTENELTMLTFKAAYLFRPGVIQPLHGIVSKTGWYRILYRLTAPFAPALQSLFPRLITTSERVGQAMIAVAHTGYPKRILENADINLAAARP